MNVIIKKPIEVPNVKEEQLEVPNISESLFKVLTEGDATDNYVEKGLPDMKINYKFDDIIKVTLSGKRNIKKLRNRMVKHMEAYPETKFGFIVKFKNDTSNKLFIVRHCTETEYPDITIKGINYKIIEKTLEIDSIEKIDENTILKIIEELGYSTTDK